MSLEGSSVSVLLRGYPLQEIYLQVELIICMKKKNSNSKKSVGTYQQKFALDFGHIYSVTCYAFPSMSFDRGWG